MVRKLISFDWAIKKLLRSKANFGILEGFLSELLFTDITILEILESETNKATAANKQNQVDIKVKDADGQIIIIEVQYSREQDYLHRILFETSKCIAEHLEEGAAYEDVAKVISVSILYFDFCQGDDYIYHGKTQFLGLHNQSQLELNTAQQRLFDHEKIADIFPEHYIINIKNFNDVASDTLDEWIYFLKNEEIKEDFKAKGLVEAKEKLDVLKLNPTDKIDYDIYQKDLHRQASLYKSSYVLGQKEGIEQGIEKGIEQGIEQGKIDAAKLGKKKAYPVEMIAEMTGLTVDEINKL